MILFQIRFSGREHILLVVITDVLMEQIGRNELLSNSILGELSRYGCSVISVWNLIFKNIEQKVHGKLSFVRSSDFPKENKPSTLTTKSKRILYFIWRWKIPSWQFNIDDILPIFGLCNSLLFFNQIRYAWEIVTFFLHI